MVMCLPDDNAGAVTRLLVYTNGANSYLKYPRGRNLSNAEEIVEDYLLANKYGAQVVKQDIIRFLESINIDGLERYLLWADFATKVYQGLTGLDVRFRIYFTVVFYTFWKSQALAFHLDTDHFKALTFKGGYLAMDVFDLYQVVRAHHQSCLDRWTKAERDAQEVERNWELRSQLQVAEEKLKSTSHGAGCNNEE